MRILILSQYFPPEVGAPQNRLSELALRLQRQGIDVVIHTAMPNYPAMQIWDAYRGAWYCKDSYQSLTVHRSWIYASQNKSIVSRLLNYFSFVFSSMLNTYKINGQFDYILVESPPLFLGISAFFHCWRKKAKLIFNVSDLWPESAEKLGVIQNKMMLKMATVLEEYCYKKAVLITGQTQGIVQNIHNRFPTKKVYWLKNGVDEKLFEDHLFTNERTKWKCIQEDFIITYAGIIGIAQGLDIIIKAASKLSKHPHIKFLLVGAGPVKQELEDAAAQLQLTNILFLPLQSKNDMKNIILNSDVSLIPLKKLDLFKGAIPSKIFEWMLAAKPVLLGVEGEAKEIFIDDANAGLFFEPENFEMLCDCILQLYNDNALTSELGQNGKNFVLQYFNRDLIAKDFYNTLISV